MRSSRFRRRQTLLAWFAIVLLVALQLQVVPQFDVSDSTTAHAASYDTLPLAFEPNHGQAGGEVQYLVHHGKSITAFTKAGATTSVGSGAVTMSLVGANDQYYVGQNELKSKTNYFIGNDPSQWQSDIPNYQSLLAEDVYPGIDLTYYGTNSQLEHDFIVAPGADYTQITFTFMGQENLHLDDNGDLILKVGNQALALQAPKTYQEKPGSIQTIPSSFVLDGDAVRFALHAEYDHSRPLVIDPTLVLINSTYLGGSGTELGISVAVDASGYAYVVGQTTSSNFPTASPFQGSNAGGSSDAYISKFDQATSALIYSTYLGGSLEDYAVSVEVDAAGNAYFSGDTTSTNFPISGPIQASNGGGARDAFLAKLNPTGSGLIYSTYLGGSGSENGNDVTIDATGNAYVHGNTNSANFPTSSPLQASNGGGGDLFISKVNAAGSAFVFSTYLGGTGGENSGGIQVDAVGNAYIVGSTASTNFPTTSPIQGANGGGSFDAFAAKINASGSALVYATYIGGSGTDSAYGNAVDASGNLYVAGNTTSTNFPTTSPYQGSSAGGQDTFAVKINAAGSAFSYATYFGGSGTDTGRSADLDASNNFVFVGSTTSTNFPTASAYQASNGGGIDGFVVKLNSAGSAPVFSTYFGGSGTDEIRGAFAAINTNTYGFGDTTSSNLPTLSPYQGSLSGTQDAFLVQFSENSVTLTAQVNPTLTFDLSSNSCALGTLSVSQTKFCTYTVTAATNGTNGYTISYLPASTLTSGADTISHLPAQAASLLGTEQFGFNLRANTAVGSNTATDFGADPNGGVGTVAATYNTTNQFKFSLTGDTIATTTGPSVNTIFTIGTIANIASSTEAGAYTTTLTYNVVSGY